MKKAIFLISLCSIVALNASSNVFPQWFAGTWHGVGYQPGMNVTWNVELSVHGKGKLVEINYPTLSCGGNWELKESNGNQLQLVEIITRGKGTCIDGSKVYVVKVDNDHIHVTWDSGDIEGIDASCVLVREDLQWLNGAWEGIGYQSNTDETWSVEMEFDVKDRQGRVNYPSLYCSGDWTFFKYKKGKVYLGEQIKKGLANCMEFVDVIVTPVDDWHIAVIYFDPVSKKAIATALLRNSSKAGSPQAPGLQ